MAVGYESELAYALGTPSHVQNEPSASGQDSDDSRLNELDIRDGATIPVDYSSPAFALGVDPSRPHGAHTSSESSGVYPTRGIANRDARHESAADFVPSSVQSKDMLPVAVAPHAASPGPSLSLNLPYLTSSLTPGPSCVAPMQKSPVSLHRPIEIPPPESQAIQSPLHAFPDLNAPFHSRFTPLLSEIPPGQRMGYVDATPLPPPLVGNGGLSEAPPLMYRCQYCPKTFLSEHGFRVHQRTHDGPKPYKCPIATCGRTFTTRPNAVRHLASHGSAGEGLPILRLSTRPVSGSGSTERPPRNLRPLTQSRVLPPPSPREPLPPASLLAACASTTRANRYPLMAPNPGALTAPCPLPPVRRRPGVEERDSWDPPPTDDPYHPVGWYRRPVLPGPAIDMGVAHELKLDLGAVA